MADRTYIAIDLKSFYASVECVDRGLDPLNANLVVADVSRTEKTICLAVSPSLKAYGIGGRARLFEVVQRVGQVNEQRRRAAPKRVLTGSSIYAIELAEDPSLAVDYIAAPPRMSHYMEVSAKIYGIYLKYIAPEDIHVYSIDEVFMDVTDYLDTYKLTPRELAVKMIRDVLAETGVTATAGIGTNLYLCKVAMDIVAKKMPADKDGVRIAELDEFSYRRELWGHRPLTDFWRVGRGYAARLEENGLYTMGDVARCSLGKPHEKYSEDMLYKLFGVNAELLIDHAWGWEPCTIADIKAYRPESNSISSGQVLQQPYSFDKGRLVVREMADSLALDLVEKGLITDRLFLSVGYDIDNLADERVRRTYPGAVVKDGYGRLVPKPVHGNVNLPRQTSSAKIIMEKITEIYDNIVDKKLTVRRLTVGADRVVSEKEMRPEQDIQMDMFTDYAALEREKVAEDKRLQREKNMQQALISIKKKYGKNAVLKGMNLEEGATAIQRNGQVGGHKA